MGLSENELLSKRVDSLTTYHTAVGDDTSGAFATAPANFLPIHPRHFGSGGDLSERAMYMGGSLIIIDVKDYACPHPDHGFKMSETG